MGALSPNPNPHPHPHPHPHPNPNQEANEEDAVRRSGNDSGLEDGANPEDCVTVGGAVSDGWCRTACAGSPPNCPAELCRCEKVVRLKAGGAEEEGETSDVPGVGGLKIDAVCGPKVGIKCGQTVIGGKMADEVVAKPLLAREARE